MSIFAWIRMCIMRWFYPELTPPEGKPFLKRRQRMKTSIRDVRSDANGKPIFVNEVRKGRRYL